MNKFDAGLFVNIGGSLQWFSTLPKTGQWKESTREAAERFAVRIAKNLREIGCDISAQAAVRFGSEVPDRFGIKPITDLEPRASELKSIIFDEMRTHLFFWVPPERARFYEYPANAKDWNETERTLLGPVAARFKSAQTEILGARQCYAVGQWTACVFHLMRACEVGIKALYKTLNVAAPRLSGSWGQLLKPMDEQLKKNPRDRHGEWATYAEFFDHATNDVRAIKRVWRDPTMHIEANYDESGARKALDAVTSFFEHLSTKVDEQGNVYQQPVVFPNP